MAHLVTFFFFFGDETKGNQASFLVEVLNSSETDDVQINFIQESGSEKTCKITKSLQKKKSKSKLKQHLLKICSLAIMPQSGRESSQRRYSSCT